MILRILSLFVVIGWSWPALAHKPTLTDQEHSRLEDAFEVEDIQTSIVVYHDATCQTSQLWMTFEAGAGDPLFVQLGVPVLDRYSTLRPRLAVLAENLPEPAGDYPFEIPAGLGIVELQAGEGREPVLFYEPFSATESWILEEGTLEMPSAGRGYIVAWNEEPREAKFWVSVGTLERFGPDDISQLPQWLAEVQEFHEVGDYARPADFQDTACQMEASDSSDDNAGGCSTVPGGPTEWPPFAAMILFLSGYLELRRQRVTLEVVNVTNAARKPPAGPKATT